MTRKIREGFFSGAPSGSTQFDPDKTQKVKFNPQDYVTKEVPAFKAPGPKLSMKDLGPPKESNAKLLMKKGPEAVMKASGLSKLRKISPSAKIEPAAPKQELPEPKSPLQGLPKETLGGSHDFGGHKGFHPTFTSRTPEAEPMHKQAPPSLANQNVRSRKKLGEGFFSRKAITPIQRISPSPVNPGNLEQPAIWRKNAAKPVEQPKVPEPAPQQPTPEPSPAPAVVPTPAAPVAQEKPAAPVAPSAGSAPMAEKPVEPKNPIDHTAKLAGPKDKVKLNKSKPEPKEEPKTEPTPAEPAKEPTDVDKAAAAAVAKERAKQAKTKPQEIKVPKEAKAHQKGSHRGILGTAMRAAFTPGLPDTMKDIGKDFYGKARGLVKYATHIKKV